MASFIDTEKRKTASNKRRSQSKASLKRVNEYIIQDEKVGEFESIESLIGEGSERVLDYISQSDKTNIKLISGINCSPSSAYDEMMVTKYMYNKTGGRQFKHFVHSYHKDEKGLTPEIAHEISIKLAEHEKFKGFQIVLATHTDTDHIHTHFVVNSVNSETGRKWQHSEKDLREIRKYSNKLCEEYGLKFSYTSVESNKFTRNKSQSMGELKAKEKGRSWKYEAFLTINEAKKISTSKEEFIKNLKNLGYGVRWVDERKNITFSFTDPQGRNRKINNDKFHPKDIFTKESLLEQFRKNREFEERTQKFQSKVKFQNLQEIYFRTVQFLFNNPEQGDEGYPMTYLEGQALREKMIEEAKGRGFDWEKEQER